MIPTEDPSPKANTIQPGASFGSNSCRSFLQAVSDPVIVTDETGLIVFCNEAAAKLAGRHVDQLVGSTVERTVAEWKLLSDADFSSRNVEAVIHQRDGSDIPVEMSFAMWEEDGRRMIGAIIRSIIARKSAEALQAAAQTAAVRAEREAQAAHERLREAMEMLPEAVVMLDADDRFILWNYKYAALFPEIAHVLKPGAFYPDILQVSLKSGDHPEVIDDRESWLMQRLKNHANPQGPTETRLRDGRWLRYDERRTSDGGTVGIRIDITELKKREASFRLLFDANPVPMGIVDAETLCFTGVNDAALRHYGFTRDEFLSMAAPDLHVADERMIVAQILRSKGATNDSMVTWNHRTARGEIKVMIFARELIHEGRPSIIAAVVDVTERTRIAERVEHLAHHDALTGLSNRIRFHAALDQALSRRRAEDNRATLLYIDLDGFKPVNDTIGHLGGDEVLRTVARRIEGAVRADDLVSRLGGDEFAVLLTMATKEPERIAERIIAALLQPFHIDGRMITVGASVGIAQAPRDGLAADSLLAHADQALYAAKHAGRSTFQIYRPNFSDKPRKIA